MLSAMRIDYGKVQPELLARIRQWTADLDQAGLAPKLRALVETRVAQINGCAYCLQLHLREARKLAVSERKLDMLATWRESGAFDEKEKAALAWTERVTTTATIGHDDDAFAQLVGFYTEREIVALGLVAALANFWTRVALGFRRSDVTTATAS